MKHLKQLMNVLLWMVVIHSLCSCTKTTIQPVPEPVGIDDSTWVFKSFTSSGPVKNESQVTGCLLQNVKLIFNKKLQTKDSLGYVKILNNCSKVTAQRLNVALATGSIEFETLGDDPTTVNFYQWENNDRKRMLFTRTVGYSGFGNGYDVYYPTDSTMVWSITSGVKKSITWVRR